MAADKSSRSREPRTGATGSRTRLSYRLKAWIAHHRQNAGQSLVRLLATPVQTAMTLMVIAIALALPGLLYIGVGNLEALSGGLNTTARLTVFLQRQTTEAEVQELAQELLQQPGMASVVYVSSEQALEEFSRASGFGEVLAHLDENPLPPVLILQPDALMEADDQQLRGLVTRLKSLATVDDVVFDMLWLQRLRGVLALAERLVLGLASILGLAVLLVMGNTIRLAIENRREEILVVKLIGGTSGYVRRPFLYTGIWIGLLSGLLAWLLVWSGIVLMQEPVSRLAALYQSPFVLQGPGLPDLLAVLSIGAWLGLCGSWLAVAQHLYKIEPR